MLRTVHLRSLNSRNAEELAVVEYERDYQTPGNFNRVGVPHSAGSSSRGGICPEGVFGNEKMPSGWTDAEIHQLLNQSPWAKEGSISDTTSRGTLGPTAAGARCRWRQRTPDQPEVSGTSRGATPAQRWAPAHVKGHGSLGIGAACPGSASSRIARRAAGGLYPQRVR